MNAFMLISHQFDPELREFSLAAASLGDSLGIAFADIAGIVIQVHMSVKLLLLSMMLYQYRTRACT